MSSVGPAVSVRARFERFPATLKGAFIVRGEDADPHQVVFAGARVRPVGAGSSRPVPVQPVTLDVVPHRDLFVPFELPTTELDPGWYTFECDLEVDGSPGIHDGGRRFSVAWPRGSVRRGAIKVGRRLSVGGSTVELDLVDCAADSISIQLRVDPPRELAVTLRADGRRLEVLDLELDPVTGRGTVTAFPLMRTDGSLQLELKGRGRERATIDVPLT